ncbi:MAG: class I SAM-dependent methyltransferase [Terriglobia bacterium]
MTSAKPRTWQERYQQPGYRCGTEPVEFLRQHLAEVDRGTALDLAMGEGRNAVFLARRGFAVTGIEGASAAIAKARALAQKARVTLTAIQANLEEFALPVAQFDLVLCFYYLQRDLFTAMERALKPGGALMVETYTTDQLRLARGPRRPEHLLQPNELYRAFRHLRVAYYREVTRGGRAVASLLAYRS